MILKLRPRPACRCVRWTPPPACALAACAHSTKSLSVAMPTLRSSLKMPDATQLKVISKSECFPGKGFRVPCQFHRSRPRCCKPPLLALRGDAWGHEQFDLFQPHSSHLQAPLTLAHADCCSKGCSHRASKKHLVTVKPTCAVGAPKKSQTTAYFLSNGPPKSCIYATFSGRLGAD